MIPPLVDLGIFTKEGKIVRSMYDKYKQINRFLEMEEDVVKGYPNKEHMHIIDFGCGKSYLTFILYYYLTECKGYQVHMTLDELHIGRKGRITAVGGEGILRCRLLDMGLIPQTIVSVTKVAPMGDPMELLLRGYSLTLRKEDARSITVEEVPE